MGKHSVETAETKQRADSGAAGQNGATVPLIAVPERRRGVEFARKKRNFSLVLARHFRSGPASNPAKKALRTGQPGRPAVAAVAAALPSVSSNQTLGVYSPLAVTHSLALTTTEIQARLDDDYLNTIISEPNK